MSAKNIILAFAIMAASVNAGAQTAPYQDKTLSAAERADDLLHRLTLDEKISLMMDVSPAIPRLGIPEYNWWNEALHGVGRAGVATVFPQCMGMAATFDDDAVYRAFDIASDEARAKYNRFRQEGEHGRYQGLSFWTPNVNIFRDPRWGRGQETYGEDPYLTTRMGVAVVKGLQGPSDSKYVKTLAGAKHYAVHSGPEWNRHTFDAKDIDPRDLWETYLPSFKALVDSGVWQVMCAYNRFDGEPCCSNKRLLSQILRDQWGYDRIVVTDCWALCDFYNSKAHHTHPSEVETSADAVYSGTDLECGPVLANLKEAYNRGLITEDKIDESVRRLLIARFSLGEIDDDPESPWAQIPYEVVDCEKHQEAALDMARKSMTLLKNDGILPLPKHGVKYLVMGPNANDSTMQWGNYNGYPSHTVTILDGIRSVAGDVPYKRACDLVVNNNFVSCFDDLYADGSQGVDAVYWNNTDFSGAPAAKDHLKVPANYATNGATVFAPGVNLTYFSGRYRMTFIPKDDGDYVFNFMADDNGEQVLRINGEEVLRNNTGGVYHRETYPISAKKGEKYEIELDYMHENGEALLRFDIGKLLAYDTDPGDAEVVIFVGGISPALEGEEMPVKVPGFRGGDRESIELPQVQRDLIHQLKEQGKKVVFVNCSGSAVAMAPEAEICDAILQAWYPGQAGGTAVAEVLFGDYNPAGRLPVTFYHDDSQLPDFQDYSMEGRTYRYFKGTPLYPFGYGLSYTTFEYKNAAAHVVDDMCHFKVDVTNTGSRDGDEVVQLYVRPDVKGFYPMALKEFRRVYIPAGKTVTVDFDLPLSAFESYNYATQRMEVNPGRYQLLYGPSSDNLKHLKVKIGDDSRSAPVAMTPTALPIPKHEPISQPTPTRTGTKNSTPSPNATTTPMPTKKATADTGFDKYPLFDNDEAATLWGRWRRDPSQFTQQDYARTIDLLNIALDYLNKGYSDIIATTPSISERKRLAADLSDIGKSGNMATFIRSFSNKLQNIAATGGMNDENVRKILNMIEKKQEFNRLTEVIYS